MKAYIRANPFASEKRISSAELITVAFHANSVISRETKIRLIAMVMKGIPYEPDAICGNTFIINQLSCDGINIFCFT